MVGLGIDTGIYWIDFNHSKVTLDDGLEVYRYGLGRMPAGILNKSGHSQKLQAVL